MIKPRMIFNLKIIGVGGAGINIINSMISSGVTDVEYIVCDTDSKSLATSLANKKINIGEKITAGLGTGKDIEKGYLSAKSEEDSLKEALRGTDMLFIVAGIGGGTGGGASIKIAEIAKKMGILSVAVLTRPFSFEGKLANGITSLSLESLSKLVDAYITLSNDNLMLLENNKNISLIDAFKQSDEILNKTVTGIKDIILNSGLINLDFADIKSILSNAGQMLVAFSKGTYETPMNNLVQAALDDPLTDTKLKRANQLLINIITSSSFPLSKLNEIKDTISNVFGIEPEHLLLGVLIRPDYHTEMDLVIIGTNLQGEGSN